MYKSTRSIGDATVEVQLLGTYDIWPRNQIYTVPLLLLQPATAVAGSVFYVEIFWDITGLTIQISLAQVREEEEGGESVRTETEQHLQPIL